MVTLMCWVIGIAGIALVLYCIDAVLNMYKDE